MKPTPETDTAEFEVIDDYECGIYVVSSCYARMLELERDELKALLTKKQGAVTISRNGYVQELERERDEAREQLTIKCEQLEQQRNALCSFINREMRMNAGDPRISVLKHLLENSQDQVRP